MRVKETEKMLSNSVCTKSRFKKEDAATSKRRLHLAFAVGAFFASALSGQAADLGHTPAPLPDTIETVSPWEFELGAYAFVPLSVQGSSTVDGGTVDLDLGPQEIFDLFQFALSGRFEGWRDMGRNDGSAFGFVLDGQYVNLGLNPKNVGPRGNGEVDVDVRQGIIDMLFGYRFPTIGRSVTHGGISFDVTAGARYNFLRQKIDVTPGLPAPFTANLGGDKHWLEPVVGARAIFHATPKWDLVLRGDLAGFGVGGDDLTWSVTGIAAWEAWDNTTLRLGYRIYDMDYSSGTGANEFAFDATEHGPFLGISRKF